MVIEFRRNRVEVVLSLELAAGEVEAVTCIAEGERVGESCGERNEKF